MSSLSNELSYLITRESDAEISTMIANAGTLLSL